MSEEQEVKVTDEKSLELEDMEGVGPSTARRLKDAGILTPLDLATSDANELIEEGACSDRDSANTLIQAANKLIEGEDLYKTALQDLKKRSEILKLTTGSKALDKLLGGGVETTAMTEFYGEFGSGKSQLCHTLCVTAQLPVEEGGLKGDVILFDTEGTFRPERVRQIIVTRFPTLTPEQVDDMLTKIHVARISNTDYLWLHIKKVGKTIQEYNCKLLIVDSLTSLHRVEYAGRGQLAERQQKLNALANKLKKIAEYFNIAVVFTNQVQAKPDTFFGDPTAAVGGNVVAHASTYRIYLKKSGANKVATMIDSPMHPYEQARFTVTSKGVEDIDENPKGKKAKDINNTEGGV